MCSPSLSLSTVVHLVIATSRCSNVFFRRQTTDAPPDIAPNDVLSGDETKTAYEKLFDTCDTFITIYIPATLIALLRLIFGLVGIILPHILSLKIHTVMLIISLIVSVALATVVNWIYCYLIGEIIINLIIVNVLISQLKQFNNLDRSA